jgi:hypothetical protein
MVIVSCLSNVVPIEVLDWLWFSASGGTRDQNVQMIADPGALAEFEDQPPVEAASRGKVELFQGGLHRESAQVQGPAKAVVPRKRGKERGILIGLGEICRDLRPDEGLIGRARPEAGTAVAGGNSSSTTYYLIEIPRQKSLQPVFGQAP